MLVAMSTGVRIDEYSKLASAIREIFVGQGIDIIHYVTMYGYVVYNIYGQGYKCQL